MNPRWIFPVLALAFALMALWRTLRNGRLDPASRTWFTVALIFSAVSYWLHRTTP
ncbi:hypothetical protein [Ideonella sp. A 288]|uniref:hypothetical protein n=1 Tax=Ideonella sp. A 288 TaxID=1962181 RepID=UPI0018FE1F5A|nr:hypothetical protein [Ideonella sp. A 288]